MIEVNNAVKNPPELTLDYDKLVVAVGATNNTFNVSCFLMHNT